MNCPRCGQDVEANAVFCSNCGYKMDQETRLLRADPPEHMNQAPDTPAFLGEPAEPTREVPARPAPVWPAPDRPVPQRPAPMVTGPAAHPRAARTSAGRAPAPQTPRRGCLTSLSVMGIALLVAVVILLLGAGAVYLGLRDREAAQIRVADEHYQRGEAYMEEARYDLAIAAYDQALQANSQHERAFARREEARALVADAPIATPVLQEETLAALWEAHEVAVGRGNWNDVLITAERIIALDPTYRRDELDGNLYEAYWALGSASIQAGRMEEAIRHLDRALLLRPQSAEALHARNLSRLYLDGARFYGADWPNAVERFESLYALDPEFQDVRVRLRDAHIGYAEQLVAGDDWCEAATHYARAGQLGQDSGLAALLLEAEQRCSDQTSDAQITPGVPVNAPSGTYAGRELLSEAVGDDRMFIRGHVLNASGRPVAGALVQIQAWDFVTTATTDGSGQFSFDGLANPVVYTLTLVELPSLPLDVETAWGRLSWVVFEQAP